MKSNGKRAHEMCILHRSSGLCRNSSLTQNIHFMHALSPLKFMFLFYPVAGLSIYPDLYPGYSQTFTQRNKITYLCRENFTSQAI